MDTTTEQPTAPAKPKNRGGWPKGRKRQATPPKPSPDELLGVTPDDCCNACVPECCAITREPFCGHPRKGGLQSKFQSKPDVLKRYNRAKQILALAKVK